MEFHEDHLSVSVDLFVEFGVFSLAGSRFFKEISEIGQLTFEGVDLSVLELFFCLEFLDLFFVDIFLFPDNFELVIFVGEFLFLDSFSLKLSFLFLSQFLILLDLLFKLIFEVGDLFFKLGDLSHKGLFFGEELWEFCIEFLGDVFKS